MACETEPKAKPTEATDPSPLDCMRYGVDLERRGGDRILEGPEPWIDEMLSVRDW